MKNLLYNVLLFFLLLFFVVVFFLGWFVYNGLVSVLCYHPYYFSLLIIPTLESCTKFTVILLFVHSPIITSSSLHLFKACCLFFRSIISDQCLCFVNFE